VASQPYARHLRWNALETFRLDECADVAVAVPARDEEERLPRCLAALEAALAMSPIRGAVVIVVNNTSDRSIDVARAWAERASVPAVLCDVRLGPDAANAAHARRVAMDVCAEVARRDAIILSTDADSEVCTGWVNAMVDRIRGGATLVTGALEIEPAEFAALPAKVESVGVVERELLSLLGEVWRRLCGDEPCPFTATASGASMGLSAEAYRAVGRLPLDHVNEDRALATAVLSSGGTLAFEPAARAITSCRLDGRAANGMADALRERCILADPPIDGRSISVRRFALATLTVYAVGLSDDAPEREHLLGWAAARLGVAPEALGTRADRVRTVHGLLSRCATRLTVSEGEVEIVRARRLLLALDNALTNGTAAQRFADALDAIDD
jgi:hypothetical protein